MMCIHAYTPKYMYNYIPSFTYAHTHTSQYILRLPTTATGNFDSCWLLEAADNTGRVELKSGWKTFIYQGYQRATKNDFLQICSYIDFQSDMLRPLFLSQPAPNPSPSYFTMDCSRSLYSTRSARWNCSVATSSQGFNGCWRARIPSCTSWDARFESLGRLTGLDGEIPPRPLCPYDHRLGLESQWTIE